MLELKALDKYLIDSLNYQGDISKYKKSLFVKTYYKFHEVSVTVEQWHTQNSFEFNFKLKLSTIDIYQSNTFSTWYFKDSCYNYNVNELPLKLSRAQSMLLKVLSAQTMDKIKLRALGFVQTSGYVSASMEF